MADNSSRRLILAVLLTCLISCNLFENKPAPAPMFLNSSKISQLHLLMQNRTISDGRLISLFITTLEDLPKKWYTQPFTYPTPQETVELISTPGQEGCRVDLGPDWIGSDCGTAGKGKPALLSLSPEQVKMFQELLGLK